MAIAGGNEIRVKSGATGYRRRLILPREGGWHCREAGGISMSELLRNIFRELAFGS